MNIKDIEPRTIGFPFRKTPDQSHLKIRMLLMELYRLEVRSSFSLGKKKWSVNGYGADDMIPKDESAPIFLLTKGKDAKVRMDDKIQVISARRIKDKQQNIDLIYDQNLISEGEVHDIQLIKSGKYERVASKSYKKELQRKSSYIVIRGEVTEYLDYLGNLLDGPIESVIYYTTFPKLAEDTSDYNYFVKGKKLIDERESMLKDKFKDIIKLNALMAASHGEGLSLVVPNAYFSGLDQDSKKRARRIFVDAAMEAAREIERDSGKYSGFCGMFVSTGKDECLNALIKKSGIKSLGVNDGDLHAPTLVSIEKEFARAIMGDGVGPVGNGALSERGNDAVEENLTRRTLGETALMFSGALNENVLLKCQYRAVSVQQHKAVSPQQYKAASAQEYKMQNIQCNRSTVYFTVAASLSSLIIALAFVTQTYIFLAGLIASLAVGLCAWSLYKKEKGNEISSNFQGDLETEQHLPCGEAKAQI